MTAVGFSLSLLASAADAGARAYHVTPKALEHDARDRALLDRMCADDVAALETLMQVYAAPLARFAASLVDMEDIAGDVVQDVFVWLWEQRATLAVQGSVGGYLYRAVRNRALNVNRHERAQARVRQRAGEVNHAEHRTVSNAGAEALDIEDVRAEVDAILYVVPPRCRQIFLLVWGHERTYAEVADILEVNVRTVQNQYYRAVAALARHFGAERARG